MTDSNNKNEAWIAEIKVMIDEQRVVISTTLAESQPLAAIRWTFDLDFLVCFFETTLVDDLLSVLEVPTLLPITTVVCDRAMEAGCSWAEIEPESEFCRRCPARYDAA